MIDHYDWAGGREAMIRLGPDSGPVVIVAPPLFEEANRTRTFAMTIMRALAELGVASALPDLPGTGESIVATRDTTLSKMREAHAAVTLHFDALGRRTYAAGIRSGALLDVFSLMFGRWHLSPVAGEDVLTDLVRLYNAGDPEYRVDRQTIVGAGNPLAIGGTPLSSAMLADLSAASVMEPGSLPQRTVRLLTDPRPADRKVDAAPLWRRAEPGNDPALAATLADDIATWVRACDGS